MAKKGKSKLEYQVRPFVITVPKELQKEHEELSWFFHCGESECGIRSNFESFLSAIILLNEIPPEDAESAILEKIDLRRSKDRIMKNVGKYRKIHKVFSRLPFKEQQIFEHFFREKQFDRSFEAHFGAGICLIPLCKSWNNNNLEEIHLLAKKDLKFVNKLKHEVSEMYLLSLSKYKAAKEQNG